MRSMPVLTCVRLLHLPTAAFALGFPRFLGRGVERGVGFAQLAFTLDGEQGQEVCGFTFSTHGLPVGEFLRHAPISRAGAASAFRMLLPSMLVANCFLPARLSASRVRLDDDGVVRVEGGESEALAPYADVVRMRLAGAFRQMGAWMLPRSFRRGTIGSDVHYASTLPMRADPGLGESSVDGEIAGMPGVFVADGAALPALPSKSHTLAIMANAHRIATRLVERWRAN
jgi:choline dehydrogenase-like flavoprotein